VKSSYLNEKKSSDFDEICYTTADLEVSDSHVTKYENFKNSRWRTAAILKIVFFGLNSAADYLISVKVCVRKQFFTQFRQWD